MGSEVVNRNRDSVFHGDYAGRDLNVTNIIMLEDKEREFVVTHNANIKPVSYFTGRETELQELRQRIEAGRKSVLVSGMGGIGKTHICRKLFEEYLNKHAEDENGPFRHIGYIEYNGDMDSSLQNCLRFKQQGDPERNKEAAWQELEYLASGGKLLLFVDNVDKPVEEDPGLQKLKEIPGAVVLTSRQASFSDEFEPYLIGFLNMEQCKEIYRKIRFGKSGKKISSDETQDLEYIIESLAGKHTITVELLAHLARTKLWAVKRLRDELEQKGFRLEFHKGGKLVNIQESYEKLYDLSELTKAEQNILEAFSVFPYIPLEAEICNQWLLADAGASEDEDILMGLYQKGWLQFGVEQESYSMHPVFAQFIYEKCKPKWGNHSKLLDSCEGKLKVLESGSILGCHKLILFADNIIEKLISEVDGERLEFKKLVGCLLQQIGEYEKAQKLYEKLLEIYKGKWEENSPDIANIYSNLSVISMEQGQYRKAEELGKKCLQIEKDIYGENHINLAASYNNLAGIYIYLEDYEKAKTLLKKSILILESICSENEIAISYSYNTLANVYINLGEYKKAERLLKKCLRIRESILGKDHLDVAIIYNNLAEIYFMQSEYQKAEELYKKSLQIRESVLGENHAKTARGYHNLSVVYLYEREHTMAIKMCNKGLRIWKKVMGDKHPDIACGYNTLAQIYEAKGDWKNAINYYVKAYKIYVLFFGRNHFHAQSIYKDMQSLWYRINIKGNFVQWLEKK